MLKEFTATGKTVEAAVEAAISVACVELDCSRDDHEWDIEVVDMPRRGFFGLKVNPAKARVSVDIPEKKPAAAKESKPAQKPEQKPAQKQEQKPKQQPQNRPEQRGFKPKREQEERTAPENRPQAVAAADISEKERLAKEYLEDIISAAGLKAECVVTREYGGVCINIVGDGLGMIIGRRGETLDAIQYLAGLVANRGEGDYLRLTVDCGDYRLKRKDTLEGLAKKLAGQVLKTNVSKTLEPMNPFERRIIHATVSKIEGVSSSSVGEEPNRRVVITSPTSRPAPRSGYRSGERSSGGYNSRQPRRDRYDDIKTIPAKPEAVKLDVAKPEAAKPDAAKPEIARPDIARQDSSRQETSQRPQRENRDNRDSRDNRRGSGPSRDSDRRRGGGGGRRQSAPVPVGPPKKTPESEKTAGISFGKIDLE